MKKVLLTGTALASSMLFASVAQAQITVSLGGYTEFFAGFYDDDQPNRTEREFMLETEIVVRADGKADNGLLYGAKVELQNSTGGSGPTGVGTDEASVYLGGTWGRLELGDFDGAADTLKIYAPLVGVEQIDGDSYKFLANTTATAAVPAPLYGSQPGFGMHIPNSGDATKVMYLTPRFAGFQAGASYTPQSGSEAQNVVQFDSSTGYEDWIEGGINYTGNFSGFSVALGATISSASARDATGATAVEDFTAWNFGGQVGFGGFVLGGGYVDADDFNVPTLAPAGDDQSVWHAGLSYTAGPIAVAASYMDAEGFKGDGFTYASDYKSYGVGATYTLAPGFIVESDLMWVDEDVRTSATGPTTSNEGWVFVLGTRLDF